MKYEILIKNACEETGNLDLRIGDASADTLEVDRLNHVTWSIATPNVFEFRIAQKNGSDQIFTLVDRPSAKYTKATKGRVSVFAKKGDLYDYSIYWKKDNYSDGHEYDPKISVNPSFSGLLPIIAVSGFLLTLGIYLTKLTKRHH